MPNKATRRAIAGLIERLVAARLRRTPGAAEAELRRGVYGDLAQHAGLANPNRLDRRAAAQAHWVLLAWLELEADRHLPESP